MKKLSDFYKCVTKRKRKNGKVSINCKLGLWAVSAPDEDSATIEALRYWQQYARDGEYSSIIGGQSIVEKLTQSRGEYEAN